MGIPVTILDDITPKVKKLGFDILIDDSLANLCTDKAITPKENKRILSVINDFQEGKWRYGRFSNFIWNNIAETALSSRERASLADQSQTQMINAAKNLRLTDKDAVGEASELAEIVLYAIMKLHFGALPVVPKIFYKQNAQDNAKGADSVHIVLEDDDDFSIWFGEAKFFNSIEDTRLSNIVSSVKKSLDTKKLKKENSIIVGLSDLDELIKNEAINNNIKILLSQDTSIDHLKPKLNIPILLLHECDKTKVRSSLSEEYKEEIKAHHTERAIKYFEKQIAGCKEVHDYSSIKFHIILFPVPSKDEVVKQFIKNVSHYKSEDID